MSHPICPNYTRPEMGFCPVGPFQTAPENESGTSYFVPLAAVTLTTLAAAAHMFMASEAKARARASLKRAAVSLLADGVVSAAKSLAPLALDAASGLAHRASALWGRLRPAAPQMATAILEHEPVAPIVDATPDIHPAAVLERIEESSLARYREAAQEYILNLDLDTFSPDDYRGFLQEQRLLNPEVTIATMHELFASLLLANCGTYIDHVIYTLGDISGVDASILERKAKALSRKKKLLEKEAILAGADRFNGLVDAAWREHFQRLIAQTESLSRLCHYLHGEGSELTPHEHRMLYEVLHAHHERGLEEIAKMQKGLMQMIGMPSLQQTLLRGRQHQNTEGLCSKLQGDSLAVSSSFSRYTAMHADREEIAGEGINPEIHAAAGSSLLAMAEAEGVILDREREQEIERRHRQMSWLESFKTSTQSAHVTLEV